jgi:hypothetical protein
MSKKTRRTQVCVLIIVSHTSILMHGALTSYSDRDIKRSLNRRSDVFTDVGMILIILMEYYRYGM